MLRNQELGESITERVVLPLETSNKMRKTYFHGIDTARIEGSNSSSQHSHSSSSSSSLSHNSSQNDLQEEDDEQSTVNYLKAANKLENNNVFRKKSCIEDTGDDCHEESSSCSHKSLSSSDSSGSLKNCEVLTKRHSQVFKVNHQSTKHWSKNHTDESSPSSQFLENIENEIVQAIDIRFSDCGNCSNYEARDYANIFSEESGSVGFIIGWLLIIIATLLFTGTVFSIFFAPFLLPTTHNLFEFLRSDNYYCFFVPLSSPVIVLIVYANWLAMKFFLHS